MMKDLLKHTIACRIAGCLAAFCLTFVSCTSTVDDGLQNSRAITFTPAADTRAAVTGSEDMGDFQVWGWYGGDGTAAPNNVFDGTVVYKDAGWNYTDGVRYWKAGETYNFYAVYPTDVKANVSSDGTITVTNFDCSKTGTEAVDLMTATATGVVADYMIADSRTVFLQFKHELVRVNILVKTEGDIAYVTEAELSGMLYKGKMVRSGDTSKWQNTEAAEAGNTPFYKKDLQEVDLKGISILDEMLLIPQETNKVQLTLDYNYGYEGSESHSTAYLPDVTWNAGQSYTYTLTIEGDGRIHFASPTVSTWGEAMGGIIIVD